jgi:plasmid replication initiation protein
VENTDIAKVEKVFRKGQDVAIRSNIIIEAKYNLTAKENDIVDILLTEIEPDDNLEYEINIHKYKKFYNYDDGNNVYSQIKKAVKSIEVKRIYSNELNSKKSYSWFPKIDYQDKDGKIILELHKDVKKAMVEFKSAIYYNIKYTLPLQSNYAKRFYYFCKSFEGKTRFDNIETLKEKLEITNKYSNYSDLKRYVLNPVKEQINKYTDIRIAFEEKRLDKNDKRKVTNIHTIVYSKSEDEINNIGKNKKESKNNISRKSVMDKYYEYTKNYDDVKAKKLIAENLNISRKTVNIYINLTNKLIEPLIEMVDNKSLTITEAILWAKESKEVQESKLDKIKAEAELKALKKAMKKNKNKKIIDVEYKEVESNEDTEIINDISNEDTEIINDINNNTNNDINKEAVKGTNKIIEQIKENLIELQLDNEQAEKIYKNSKGDLDYINYIYGELKRQRKDIPNAIGWIIQMVKPNVYKTPIKQEISNSHKKLRFDNFKGREYDYDALEKKLLGWDKVDDEDEEVEENRSANIEVANDIIAQIERLNNLKNENIITEAEFEILKSRIVTNN